MRTWGGGGGSYRVDEVEGLAGHCLRMFRVPSGFGRCRLRSRARNLRLWQFLGVLATHGSYYDVGEDVKTATTLPPPLPPSPHPPFPLLPPSPSSPIPPPPPPIPSLSLDCFSRAPLNHARQRRLRVQRPRLPRQLAA